MASAAAAVCVFRVAQMQIAPEASIREEIKMLKEQRGEYRLLKTLRGSILDRKGNVLAVDEPQFQVHVNYQLSRFADVRVQRAMLLRAAAVEDPSEKAESVNKVKEEIYGRLGEIQSLLDKCSQFGAGPADVDKKIRARNDKIWNLRAYMLWLRAYKNQQLLDEYGNVPGDVWRADLEGKIPDEDERILRISKVDLAEMHGYEPILELKTEGDKFKAQLEFSGIDGVAILPEAVRAYPYGSAAAQTIGWVGLEQEGELFAEDKLSRYLEGEISGRRPGVEYVCEAILRGRRGEEIYDMDEHLVERTETQLGRDVQLSLDIELQKRIEDYLGSHNYNRGSNAAAGMAAVVLDVATGEILALVSLPTYDLNRVRFDYDKLVKDKRQPLRNRALNESYPPGSVAKPLVLIAGLESGKITADEPISCPSQPSPRNWPNCWVWKYGVGHDAYWTNKARNAIKGSCNVYFSHLADRLEPLVFQRWLFAFGYGRRVLGPPATLVGTDYERNLRQSAGVISSSIPESDEDVTDVERLPEIDKRELRYLGIGQGNFRATPLQVASAMAAISRGGVYAPPTLYLGANGNAMIDLTPLGISPETISVVRDGMHAVTSEYQGTAYETFNGADFAAKGVTVYGKTGSTTSPEHAWFGGFAEDTRNRAVAVAVVLEGGQSGGSDAAPAAREIINFCIEAGYIGSRQSSRLATN